MFNVTTLTPVCSRVYHERRTSRIYEAISSARRDDTYKNQDGPRERQRYLSNGFRQSHLRMVRVKIVRVRSERGTADKIRDTRILLLLFPLSSNLRV